jgi:tetratricopeptide (TPR) repeat protein
LNNKRLVQIIKDPGKASEKEIKEINALSKDYSYASFLKILQARLDNQHGHKNKSKSITRAAIYTANRIVLKNFISNDNQVLSKKEDIPKKVEDKAGEHVDVSTENIPSGVAEITGVQVGKTKDKVVESKEKEPDTIADLKEKKAKEQVKEVLDNVDDGQKPKEEAHEAEELDSEKVSEAEVAPEEKKQEAISQTESTVDSEDYEPEVSDSMDKPSLSSEIMKNISELRKHKASLFNLLEVEDKAKNKSEKKNKSKKSSEKGKSKADVDKEAIKDKGKSKEKIKDKADKLGEPTEKEDVSQDYPDYEKEDPKVIKEFLDDLEKSNPPPSKKLKKEEQKELIEKFIQTDPQMQNVRSSRELPEKKDLSLPSVKFRDDIISENLACIMVKQGKHEKAIDIYKKLIWKFPQKKTYFASQIEELKKSDK